MASNSRQSRRRYDDDYDYRPSRYPPSDRQLSDRQPYPYQPPVIVLAAPREQPRQETHYHVHCLNGPPPIAQREAEIQRYHQQQGRVFRIVGERVEPDDETGEGYPVVSHGTREDW